MAVLGNGMSASRLALMFDYFHRHPTPVDGKYRPAVGKLTASCSVWWTSEASVAHTLSTLA